MADLTVTAANVGAGSDTQTNRVQIGEAVTQGQCVYKKAADGKYWLADNSTTTLAAAAGIALTGGATDEYIILATKGDIDIGATLAIGTIYTVSSTSGAIHPELDIATTEIVTILGYGKTAAIFTIDITQTEIAHA